MGHLTNPIGFRAGRTQTWKGLWASSAPLYAVEEQMVERVTQYFKLFFGFILGDRFRDKGLVYSHIWLRSKINRLAITIFLYSANLIKFQKWRYIKFLNYVHAKVKSPSKTKGQRKVKGRFPKVKVIKRVKRLKGVKKLPKIL